MASFFQKVWKTECSGELNKDCPDFVSHKPLPEGRMNCDECGSKGKQFTKLDIPKILAVLFMLGLLTGGGVFLAQQQGLLWSRIPQVGPDLPPRGDDGRSRDRERPDERPVQANSGVQWTIDADQGGSKRTLSPSRDFQLSGGVFISKEAFHQGDRLRLQVTYKADRLYAFYNGKPDPASYGVFTSGQSSIPKEGAWELDGRPGTEELILVASSKALSQLDQMTGTFDSIAFDNEIRRIENGKDPAVIRIQIKHE